MLTIPHLTDDQVAQFAADGYLILRGGFSAADMAAISACTD